MGNTHNREAKEGSKVKRSYSLPEHRSLPNPSPEKKWRIELMTLRPSLVDNIDQLESLLDFVEAENVLEGEAVRKIRETPHNDEKIRLLVNKLLKRTKQDWLKFKNCMIETGNGHLITNVADEPSKETHATALSEEHPMNPVNMQREGMHTEPKRVSTWGAFNAAKTGLPVLRSVSKDEGQMITHSAPDSMDSLRSSFKDKVFGGILRSMSVYQSQAKRHSESEACTIPHSSSQQRVSVASGMSSGMSSRSNSILGSPAACSSAYSSPASAVFGLDSSRDSEDWEIVDESDVIDLMTKDLKGRYRKNYKKIMLLPWRQDKKIPISQISRNFEMKKEDDTYSDVTLDDILVKADEDKNDRFVLEAPAGYGKTSFMKKIAYMWATDDEHLCHFEFVFLISTDDFIEFQSHSTDGGSLAAYITSDKFFTKQSLKKCHPTNLNNYLEHNQNMVLFIIDNNYKAMLPEEINQIFLRKDMAESTVIFTCRTNQVPALYLDNANLYTSLRIIKHHPDTISKHISEYFQWKRKEDRGTTLLQNLGISNTGDDADTARLAWLTVPLVLVIVAVLWEDMCDEDTEQVTTAQKKENFDPDKPYIYQKVLKNIFKKYECHVEGLQSRVSRGNKKYEDETLLLGKLAWQLILDKRTGIPKEKLFDSKYDDDTVHVLRNVGLLEPFTRRRDGINYEEYRFVDDIWKFYLAARYLKKEEDEGMIGEEEITDAIRKVRNLGGVCYQNISELFAKFVAM